MKRRDFLKTALFSSLSFSYLFSYDFKSFPKLLIVTPYENYSFDLIKQINPTLVLFFKNSDFSGVGISENRYNYFNLLCEAHFIVTHINILTKDKLKLFRSENDLVNLCLKNNIKAFEIQLFRNLSVNEKKDISFKIVKEFSKLNGIQINRS